MHYIVCFMLRLGGLWSWGGYDRLRMGRGTGGKGGGKEGRSCSYILIEWNIQKICILRTWEVSDVWSFASRSSMTHAKSER